MAEIEEQTYDPPLTASHLMYFNHAYHTLSEYGADIAPVDVTDVSGLGLAEGRVSLGISHEPPTITRERLRFYPAAGGIAVDKSLETVTLDSEGVLLTIQEARQDPPIDGVPSTTWTEREPIFLTGKRYKKDKILDNLYAVVNDLVAKNDEVVIANPR